MAKDKTGNWFGRHKVLTVVGVLVVLLIIGAASSSSNKNANGNTQQTAANQKSTKKQSSSNAKIGQAANDGKFSFTVNSFKCGETSVGNQYLNKAAQGQFCRLNVSVKNIGNEAQTLDTSSQYLYSATGQKYSSDGEATIDAAPSSNSPWLAQVNPGNTITGDIIFDVPKGVTPVKAELHDSAFSGGVTVDLQQ